MEQRLQAIHEAMVIAGALRTAAGADLFRRLAESPLDAAGVACASGWSERGTRRLMASLAGLGLLTVDQAGRYEPAFPELAHLNGLLAVCDGLPEAIRTGRPALACDTPAGVESLYAHGGRLLDLLLGEAAERAAGHLAGPGLRILELGAGTAVWSRAIARHRPDAQVCAVDLPPVVATARQAVAADGLLDRYTFHEGDLFTEPWPGGGAFDLVLVPNLCHLFGPEQNAWLLARAGRVLRVGGRMAVIDLLADEAGSASDAVALYALGLLARTATGQVYSFARYVQWMRDAGLGAIERYELGGRPPLSMVEGTY